MIKYPEELNLQRQESRLSVGREKMADAEGPCWRNVLKVKVINPLKLPCLCVRVYKIAAEQW